MPYCDDKQLALLLDRVEELCIRAEAGRFTHTDFLTPREAKHAAALGVSGLEYEGCCYLKFHLAGNGDGFLQQLALLAEQTEADELVFASEHPLFDKYDAMIPGELLRRAYARDRLSPDEVRMRLRAMTC